MSRELPTKTERGRRWLVKALHPADGSLKAERVPASSRYPTVVQEVVSRFTIECPSSVMSTDTWGFRLYQTTDPLCPIVVSYLNTPAVGGIASDPWNCGHLCKTWVNPVFFKSDEAFKSHTAEEYLTMMRAFLGSCETYRITALSTTGEFIGASLTDQGAVMGVQYPDRYKHMTYFDGRYVPNGLSRLTWAGQQPPSDQNLINARVTVPDVQNSQCLMSQADIWLDPLPPKSQSTMAAHPYTDKAKEGWYMPQKLLAPGHWHSTNDVTFRGRLVNLDLDPSTPIDLLRPSEVVRWPLGSEMYESSGPGLWVKSCDDGLGVVYVDGLAKTTTFQVIVRMNLELGVSPMNEYAPFAEITPPPDSVAIELYNEIVKDMFDAYPSRDNSLGTLINKIKGVAKKVLGFVEPIAGIAGALGVPYASAISGVAGSLARGGLKDIKKEDIEDAILDWDVMTINKARAALGDEAKGLKDTEVIALWNQKHPKKKKQILSLLPEKSNKSKAAVKALKK